MTYIPEPEALSGPSCAKHSSIAPGPQATAFLGAALALLSACALLLSPAPASAESTGFLTGTVTDAATSQPLQSIGVCAYPGDGSSSCATSDSEGRYVIGGLATGSYKVGFSSIDHTHLTQFYSGKESMAEADPVSVADGATTSGINVEMQEGGKIAGKVSAAFGGAPIGGVTVCALEASGSGSPLACAGTDVEGDYTITGLAGGPYKVEFFPGLFCDCESENYLTQFYSGKESWVQAKAVSVTTGATTSGIDAQMVSANTYTLAVSLVGSGSGTVTSAPAAITCGLICSHEFGLGSSVALTAVPSAGSSFAGWSGGCTGIGACEVVLNGDIGVTAMFQADAGTPQNPLPPTPVPFPSPVPKPKKLKCKRGFEKKRVRGEVRCVRVKKHKCKQMPKHRVEVQPRGDFVIVTARDWVAGETAHVSADLRPTPPPLARSLSCPRRPKQARPRNTSPPLPEPRLQHGFRRYLNGMR